MPGIQIRIRPPRPTRLTPAQASVSDQQEQRIEPVMHDVVQELPGLLRDLAPSYNSRNQR
jgi:hypothetical protein